ncbi:cardiolipin synthase ClsB [Noviherbaspirillum galbum]|uniref:Cardiolipin synthase B n=1 Tax=Noviherbaspirillum galbum TaxID=2709383 RepID=A0A6B3SFV4_9BURK|nr:cardiolipin synthase ClsB [Noviherbaspirillum galbum]NEX59538.1 cardiolipin synthase ClsB [Noviherbaspirillum galbum]
MTPSWIGGNKFTLLENGEEYYPRLFAAIDAARQEVLIETFILYDDKVGRALRASLLAAASRGVRIEVTIDGFGSHELPDGFIASLTGAGVRVHVFDPAPRLFKSVNYFRRLHRKLAVVDGRIAFVGGINYSADHLADYGPEAKQDFAVAAEGPITAHIHGFMRAAIQQRESAWHRLLRRMKPRGLPSRPEAGDGEAIFVWRDNGNCKTDIERYYRLAIRLAKKRVVIANAYFFPGYAFLRELRRAARRGVQVTLILQGNPDMPIVQTAASMLYHYLLHGGVTIHEYCKRPLHGKVALIDDEWAFIGSSNLDPFSLALNLEANLVIRDRQFNQDLYQRLEHMTESCKAVSASDLKESRTWRKVRSFFLFHFLKHYPSWAGALPAHAPKLRSLPAAVDAASQVDEPA